jgi:L-alanine-DL-glutamate epimerase-like enolase superfamily enzyme
VDHGELVAPPGPGLGLALDEAALRRHHVAA